MQRLDKDQFRRKYLDTHKELAIIEQLSNNGSLIKSHPEDKGITTTKIAGKSLIEKQAKEERYGEFEEYLLDALSVRADEILQLKFDKLLDLITRNKPQQIQSEVNNTFTFTDMVKKATLQLERMETIDVKPGISESSPVDASVSE
jgi:hypothetical protein